MSRSLAPALVTADDIMEYDLDGNPVDPRGRASFLERFIHAEIYRARPDVQAVIHSHANAVIPFSVSKVPLPPGRAGGGLPAAIRSGVRYSRGVRCNQHARLKSTDRARPGADPRPRVRRTHARPWMVVAAPTLPLAVYRAIYTAVDAKLESEAVALGGSVTYLDPDEAARWPQGARPNYLRAWDLWKRQLEEQRRE